MLTDLFKNRGVKLDRTYQLNTGGNIRLFERARTARGEEEAFVELERFIRGS